jgi:hypothetical protein
MSTPSEEPIADTAGEQDHSNPWDYAGDDADAPGDD